VKPSLFIASLLVCLSAVAAQSDGLWIAEYENDIFAGEDRYYTSGVRLSRVGTAREAPDWLESVALRFPGFGEAEALPYSFSISHNIFTPADIENPQFPPDDRPYAAWLNVEFGTGTLYPSGADRVRVGLGVVGPAALGETIQKAVHKAIGADTPTGWDRQLKNEPTLQLAYDRFRRLGAWALSEDLALDFSGMIGATAGNAYTYAHTGAFVRFGRNLPVDFGPPRITPAPSGSGFFKPGGKRSWYVYLGTEGRLVGRDLFIEGNTFGGRDGVNLRRAIGEVFGGLVYTHNRLRLSYTHVWRSREFKGQVAAQDYGSLSASLWW
jgi:hypothetical protein